MVTPYTNRLFNCVVRNSDLRISVLSCTEREQDRNWTGTYASDYQHIVLRGFSHALKDRRIAHLNPGIWRALSRLSPDVVAINGLYPTMLIAALWSVVHRRPLVFMTDGWRHIMPMSPFHRAVRPLVFGKSAAFICSSEKGRQYFLEEGIAPQHIFVAHIIPSWPAPAEAPGFDERPHHLLWCARIDDPRKNAPFFFDVALALKRRVADLRLHIVADSNTPPHAALQALSNAGLQFDYTPFIPPERIAAAFLSARMLALPSSSEAWGLVCNEAMQCGTPCIVSPFTGAAGDLVVDGASGFVRGFDVEAWAATIAATVTDRPRWEALSRAAIAAAGRYSLEESASAYIKGLSFPMSLLPAARRSIATEGSADASCNGKGNTARN
jgi:glycosyltransferase involved in cell wall biosynthesis